MGLKRAVSKKFASDTNVSKRICRICGKEQELGNFRVGPSGRRKIICNFCVNALIQERWGDRGARHCASCGRATANYRCGRCWRAMRNEGDGSGFDPNYLPGGAPVFFGKRRKHHVSGF